MKKFALVAMLLFFTATLAHAEVAVIVHPSNTDSLSQEEIKRLYMAKTKTFPSGAYAIPIDLEDTLEARQRFITYVLERDSSQMKAYWAKLVFTGRARPPATVSSEAEMLSLIAANPNMIGYVDAAKVTPDVKVVGTF